MYSVEDLLISHGYKLPKHGPAPSTPTPAPASSSHQAPPCSPPSYSKHHEILENRPTPRTENGYERGSGMVYGNGGGGARLPLMYAIGCPNNNNESRDRSQPRREGESRSQNDTHSLGESLTSDSGFCDGSRGSQPQSRDVSYWRRRGQDFTVLLDYAEYKDSNGGGQGGYGRPEGPQQARGQELCAEEHQRAAQERQRWAAQAQAQVQAQVQARSREREAALHQWRIANERKCQSLGTDEWRPAVSFGRQLSQSEGERWTQEQQRIHARTPEGMVVHPRTKAKSQSLPRMLQPESLQYVDIASSGQELYRRVNGQPLSHHDLFRAPRWPENGRPASANQLSMTPKPRFTRPPRPPSYEMHQQIRGSCEVLSGRDSVISQGRDRTPLPLLRTSESQLDYFAQDSGPPGYIPPPSYKRAPIMGGGRRGYGEIHVDYRYRGDVYHQIQVTPDGSHWFTRHPAGSWPDPQRERKMSSQKQLYPVYTTQERPGGGVQYIPFDDPRIRHISSALGGNSLTDADKIRHIRNELPSVTVSEPASDDSAFLPPPLGPFITAKLGDDAIPTSSSDFDNDNNRWHSNLHKDTVDNFPATDQNCNNRYPKNQRPPPSPSSAFQGPLSKTSPRQRPSSELVFAETITQVKKIVPDSGPENNRNTKRRVSETIFCLVSVPVHTPTNINKDSAADQNNNETIPSLTVSDTFAVGLKESHNVRSKSVNEMPIKSHYSHFHTSSTSSMRNYKRAPLRKEIIDAWALQANEDKELCYAGSWPGNQYRNQETQTGSPLTVVKSPEPQSPPDRQKAAPSVSDTPTDSGMATDSSSSFGFPMAGQKNLHLSSNSAFSRLSPTQAPSLEVSQQDPSTDQDQGEHQLSSPKKKNCSPPDTTEQVVFGQFLLKPVNRRPCDAIGELESINKEMEDTISKRPNVTHCLENLPKVNKKLGHFKPGAHFTAGLEPGREAFSLPPMHIDKPNIMKARSKSFTSATDLASLEISSAFSRLQGNNLSTHGQSILSISPLLQHSESRHLYRQDIPVPQESLLRDVGLTVYTETPGGPGEPVQRSLSVPSPLDHKEQSESLQLSQESRAALVKNRCSPEHNLNEELRTEAQTLSKAQPDGAEVSLSICRTKSEGSRSPKNEATTHVIRLSREASFLFEDDDDDDDDDGSETYTLSEPLTYKNESTMADKHLENLLIQEKANALPAEDLSNLYEVKCAKGIPENESIEQRAARILGIAVPVEALGVADKQLEDEQDDTLTALAEKLHGGEEVQQVIGRREQVEEESLIIQEVKEEQPSPDPEKHRDEPDSQDNDPQPAVAMDLPEFPPSTLPLSLPVNPDDKLALSMFSGEKRGCGGARRLIESLQDQRSSSTTSLTPSVGTDRMAHLKELDSVSPIRRLSLKGSDSGEEFQSEDKEDDGQVSEVQEEADKDVEEEEGMKKEGNRTVEENVHETQDRMGGAAQPEDYDSIKDDRVRVCEEEERQEWEEMNVQVALKADNEGSKEVADSQVQELQVQTELKIVEDEHEECLEKGSGGQSPAEVTKDPVAEEFPKPKQRTRLQKPPLLPKPRSVPKREITLPLSFSTGTCGPANMEDDEAFSISDSYDPSRVERV